MSDVENEDNSRNLLDKADEFLRRRRAQLGSPTPEAVPRVDTLDNIPVLTEVVIPDASPASTSVTEASVRDFSADVAREMDAWLDEHLPQVVMHALDGVTDRLIARIHESARTDLLPHLQRTLNENKESGEN